MSIFFQVLVSQCNSHFQIQKQYKIVLDIKSQSGFSRFSWDNEFSASIDSTSEVVWAVYVKEFFLFSLQTIYLIFDSRGTLMLHHFAIRDGHTSMKLMLFCLPLL